MKLRKSIAAAAAVAAMAATLAYAAPTATATVSDPTTIGVYRWDAWHGGTGPIYEDAIATLQPSQYRTKVPFFGVTNPDGSVDVDDTDAQWKMDDQIEYAADAGIDYWAFLHYSRTDPLHSPMNESFEAYLASSKKSDLNFSLVLSHELNDALAAQWPDARDYIVGLMKDPQWQTVKDGRPLLYLLYDTVGPNLATRVADLRTAAAAEGLDDPYLVAIDFDPTAYGVDARTSWTPSTGANAAWSTYRNSVESQNTGLLASGDKAVLGAHVNWDSRPYHDNPPFWWATPPNAWAAMPTSAEYRDLLQSSVNRTQTNAVVAEANTIFVYAWNELAEGGIMVPTKRADGSIDTTVLDGVAQVDKTGSVVGSANLALGRATYTASSQWDASQAAAKAFDGSPASNWQAQSGSSFGSQWLEVNLGAPLTVSSATISEYGNRTTGYRLLYWTGTAWATAYTGGSIGPSANVSFPPVTTDRIRLDFDSGSFTPVVYEFELRGVSQNLALGRSSYTASSQWDASQSAAKAFDGSAASNWQAADLSVFADQWLEVNLGAPLTVSSATISEYGNRTTGYRLLYWTGTAWATAYTGGSIGSSASVSFPAVTTDRIRLDFDSGTYQPVVYEFELRG